MKRKRAKRWVDGVLVEEYVDMGPGGAIVKSDSLGRVTIKNPAREEERRVDKMIAQRRDRYGR